MDATRLTSFPDAMNRTRAWSDISELSVMTDPIKIAMKEYMVSYKDMAVTKCNPAENALFVWSEMCQRKNGDRKQIEKTTPDIPMMEDREEDLEAKTSTIHAPATSLAVLMNEKMKLPVAYVASGNSYTRKKTSTWNNPKIVYKQPEENHETMRTYERDSNVTETWNVL